MLGLRGEGGDRRERVDGEGCFASNCSAGLMAWRSVDSPLKGRGREEGGGCSDNRSFMVGD